MGKKDGLIVIWPTYFDLGKSRSEGRMLPKGLAVDAPTAEEIYEVCSGLKLSPLLEEKKRMPRASHARPGRVLLKKEGAKQKVLREIALALQKKRSASQKKQQR